MKNLIINVAIDYWYPKAQKRLLESLKNNFGGTVLHWTNEFPNDNFNKENLYNCKASAFEQVINKGYDNILWLDCSVWAVNKVQPIFDIIEKDGYYFLNNGYNCAQTCSDKCLEYYRITRDVAETYTEVATGIFGVSLKTDIGWKFIEKFIEGCKEGAADGSRLHDGQSKDERFLFHRQDQSVASIVLARMGLKPNDNWGGICEYNPDKVTDKTIFTLRGM